MFKFTIVRNPFSRFVSGFFYLRKHKLIPKKPFLNFVKEDFAKDGPDINIHFHKMYPKSFFKGKQFVDFIAKLENIEQDWKFIAKQINSPATLPKLNKSKKKKFHLDDEAIEIISNIYKKN